VTALEPLSQHFPFVISQIGSQFCLGLCSNHNPPTYVSHVTGITVTHHHTQFAGGDEVSFANFLLRLVLNRDLPNIRFF
jgi:hypothetical protein